ncbi:MAG: tetratricopeptide repeat protein [Bacteroidales bacterium]|nr:tetratricopeptide repeat protein [Bacteroidales bacterium]
MFRTFGEKLKDIEIFYESKDYNNVVVETAKLMEQALGYLFKNFHRTLKTPKERLKFLDFEKQNDEKYSVFIKKPTIGVALGFYNSLLKYCPDHKWLNPDLKSAINKVNVVRNAQVHAGKAAVTDGEAGEVIDAAEMFLKGTEIYELPVEDVGFPLKYYLVYTSIQEKFKKGETESDFRKIISDASKLIPDLLNSVFNKVYPFLPIADKEKLNQLHPKTLGAKSKEISLKYFIEIFDEIKLFDRIENGNNLKRSLQSISKEGKEIYSRRETRHHVSILEIIFNFIHNKNLDHFLEFADAVKKKYLEDNQINETDRIILTDRAKELGISGSVAETIENTVVRTIETELILFQTLHEDKIADEKVEIGKEEKEVAERRGIRIKKSYLYPVIGMATVLIAIIIYLIWPKSDFPAYERAFLKGQQLKFVKKSKKARSLTDVRANALYIWGSYANNDHFMPEEITREYQRLLKMNPESPEAHFYLGEVYFFAYADSYENELMDSAWILINKAREMGLKTFDVDNIRRSMFSYLGIAPLAIKAADELIKDYSENPDAWNLTGSVYLSQVYDTLKAIEYYQKGIEIYPDNLGGYTGLARIYTAQREFDLALEMLDKALEINPDNGSIAYSYKELFIRSERFNEAAEFFEDIIKKYNLKHVDFYSVLADFYVQQYDTARARAFIEASLDKYPEDLDLLYSLDELRSITRLEAEESDPTTNQKVIWLEDLEEAKALAQKEDKPILAEFCDHKNNYWFRWMNRDVYSDSLVQVMLSRFIPVRLYENTNPGIFKEYEIDNAYHDLKIISADGVKLEDLERYIEFPNVLLSMLKKGLRKHNRYQLGKILNSETFNEVSNFEAARLISEAKGFPIMVLASNENSSHSRKLLNETLTDPIFISEFNNLVYLQISPERQQNLVETWNIRIFPSILFFGKDGEIIHESYGYKTPESLAGMVRKVKETYSRGDIFEPEINWLFNLEEAKTAALVEQKNIFMCSKYFRKDTTRMNELEVIKRLGDFICLSIEDLRDSELITKYGHLYRYSCLILDPSGNDLFKSVSLNDKDKLLKWLDIEEKMKKMLLVGPEKYGNYRSQIDLAEAMSNTMPMSAISVYKEQFEIFPNDLDIIKKLGEQYLNLKDADEAIKYFHRELEIESDYNSELLDNMIDAYLQLGRERELKSWFDDQIQANEKNDSIQATLYRSYSELSEILMDSTKAREYALQAIRINPDDYRSYTQLGRLLYYSGKYADARKYLAMATKNKNIEEAASAHLYMAFIADCLGEINEKQRNLYIALEKSPYLFYSLATRYLNRPLYQYPGFIALLLKICSDGNRVVNDVDFNAYYAQIIADYGNDLDLALQLINESVKKEPESWYFLNVKAWVLYRMGQYAEADKTITQYMQNEGNQYIELSISTVYHIGKIKMAVGDSIQGLEYLRKAQKFRDVNVNPMDEFIVEDVKSILGLN